MRPRRFNWPIWVAFLLSLIAFMSYFFVFVRFPVTRDFPWANLVLFGIAIVFLLVGVRRAFAADRLHPARAKIGGSILAVLSVAIAGFFIIVVFVVARNLPASHGAPQIGAKAPEFSLPDINNKPVALTDLIVSPINGKAPRGVVLFFYRGYW